MGTKSFFKNQTGLPVDSKGAVKGDLSSSLADVESSFHVQERAKEQSYLIPDIDYSNLSRHVRYALASDYYSNSFKRIRTQYPYDGSAAEKLEFYNNLTPFEKYIYDDLYPKYNGHVTLGLGPYGGVSAPDTFGTTTNPQYIRFYGGPHEGNIVDSDLKQENNLHVNLADGLTVGTKAHGSLWSQLNLRLGSPTSPITSGDIMPLLSKKNQIQMLDQLVILMVTKPLPYLRRRMAPIIL